MQWRLFTWLFGCTTPTTRKKIKVKKIIIISEKTFRACTECTVQNIVFRAWSEYASFQSKIVPSRLKSQNRHICFTIVCSLGTY